MTPTNKLRFVEREASLHPFYKAVNPDGTAVSVQTYRVLQQWWEPPYPGSAWTGEWRDVPLEVET